LLLRAALERSLSVRFALRSVSTATAFLAAFPTVDFGTGLYLMQTMTQQKYVLLAAATGLRLLFLVPLLQRNSCTATSWALC
jgi:hypothetical protein